MAEPPSPAGAAGVMIDAGQSTARSLVRRLRSAVLAGPLALRALPALLVAASVLAHSPAPVSAQTAGAQTPAALTAGAQAPGVLTPGAQTAGAQTPTARDVAASRDGSTSEDPGRGGGSDLVTLQTATVPGAPTGLTARAFNRTSISLSWTAPASNGGAAITGYKIDYSVDGNTWVDSVIDSGTTTTSYRDSSLTVNTTRHYRVAAINSVGTGAVSNTATETTNLFVSNTGQGSGTTHSSGSDQAQRFTTGTNSGGYTLTSVEVVSADAESDDFTAEIWTVDTTSGHPTGTHATLVSPGSFAAGTLTFTAPANTLLAASTTYAVVTSPIGTGDVTYSGTTGNNEDANTVGFWSIENDHEYKSGTTWRDNGSNRSLRIAVRGLDGAASSDATLSALTVGPNNIVGFASDRESYRVGVAGTVTTATVTATAADSDASVVYSGTDADPVAAGHQVSLSSGRNAVTVTVTAEDTTTTKTYSVDINRGVTATFGWKASDDLDGLTAAGSDNPRGVWSNGTTTWVADTSDDKIYAYTASTGAPDSDEDFDTLDGVGNEAPQSLWSNGTTMWAADFSDNKIYAYNLSSKAHDSTKDITLTTNNTHPRGIWSDETTMWVADSSDDKLFAYNLSSKAYDSTKDITLTTDNGHPTGIWSDETSMWVADSADGKLYAYDMSTKMRNSALDFGLSGHENDGPQGLWSDGATMWVADSGADKVFSYNHPLYATSAMVDGTSLVVTLNRAPAAAASLANSAFSVVKTPDGGTETAVTLSGSPAISAKTLTLTLSAAVVADDTGIKVSYTKPTSGSNNKLVDSLGNDVVGLSSMAVTNNTVAVGAPGAPTGLTATATGPARIDLSWTAPDSNGGSAITGYRIEVSTDGNSFAALVAEQTPTTYAHTGLSINRARHYRVAATNSAGTGPVSNTATDTTNVFVRNTGQGSDTSNDSGSDQSQRFTTGPSSGGYTLTSVGVVSEDSESDDFTAEIWTVHTTTGHPVSRLATLESPTDYAAGTLTFTAPANTTLAANTTYTVRTSIVSTGNVTYDGTSSDDEDAGFASGWSIHNTQEYHSSGIWRDDGSGRSMRIVVRGTLKAPSTDATLSALTVSPKDIIGFASDRDSYQVGVAGTVTTATVTATATDSGATVDYSGTDTDTGTAGHQVSLSSGRNAVTVTVTAEDTTTAETYTVSINRGVTTTFGWKASDDLDGLAAGSQGSGLWSDETTMWVSNLIPAKLFAYKLSDGTRDSGKDFDTLAAADNDFPQFLWSDGTTMWVADPADRHLYAYKLSDKSRDEDKDFEVDAVAPTGIWSNATTMWVANSTEHSIIAYKLSDGTRDEDEDFPRLSDQRSVAGIWSDETTMWVLDASDQKIYAYSMSDKMRNPALDFDTLIGAGTQSPEDIWSDRTTMWITNDDDDKVYSFNHPTLYLSTAEVNETSLVMTFNQDLAAAAGLANSAFAVKKTPSGGAQATAALTGTPAISAKTVTLTLSTAARAGDTVTVSYEKPTSGSNNKLTNGDGDEFPEFTDRAVTNTTSGISTPGGGGSVGGTPGGGTPGGGTPGGGGSVGGTPGGGGSVGGTPGGGGSVGGSSPAPAGAAGGGGPVPAVEIAGPAFAAAGADADFTVTAVGLAEGRTVSWAAQGPEGFTAAGDAEDFVFAPPTGGAYTVTVTVVTPGGDTLTDSVTLAVFGDITGHQFIEEIVWLAESAITLGCSREPLQYCPAEPVTRAQMATFLTRALDLAAPDQPAGFDDVDPSSVHAAGIDALHAAGITLGCSREPLQYCPAEPVTRAQMATFLTRALDLAAPDQPAGFDDVDPDSVHAAGIEALHAAGITAGCSQEPLQYCPAEPVTRAQMAAFLYRARELIANA